MDNYLIPIIASNVFAVLFLIASMRWPAAARKFFAAGFVAAGLFNAYTALHAPEIYANAYGPLAIEPYRTFILGWFQQHAAVAVLTIAAGQFLVGLLGFQRGLPRRLSLAGGIIFLSAITPLGWGAGFPATLILIAGLVVLLRQERAGAA